MQQSWIKLANVLGLDINSKQHSFAIADAHARLNNVGGIGDAFIEFCRDKKEGISFATKTERLDTLVTRYRKKLVTDAVKKNASKHLSFILNLVKKVEDTRNIVESNFCGFSNIYVDKKPFFSVQELKALASVANSTHLIIEYSRDGSLLERLEDALRGKLEYKTKVKLGFVQPKQNVLAGVKKLAEGVRSA